LLRVGEAADLLRVRPETVYRWVERGLLPSVRLGRLLRVDRKELERRLQGLPPRTAIEAKDGEGIAIQQHPSQGEGTRAANGRHGGRMKSADLTHTDESASNSGLRFEIIESENLDPERQFAVKIVVDLSIKRPPTALKQPPTAGACDHTSQLDLLIASLNRADRHLEIVSRALI